MTDEFWSGVAVVGAPDVEREQGLVHGSYALLVLALPLLGSALLEAIIALVSERYPRRRVVRGSLLAAAAALAACAFATGAAWLACGLALAGALSGAACSAAQAELVARSPEGGERAMMRWVLFGSVGDVLTPLLVALILGAGGSYRGAFLAAAALAMVHAALVAPGTESDERPWPEPANGAPTSAAGSEAELEEASLPLLAALRLGARERMLWLWLLGAGLCTLLDEIVVALAALHAHTTLGASPSAAVACVTGASLGGVLGAWLTERLLAQLPSERVLFGSACAALVALAAVVAAPSVLGLGLGLVALGAAAAPQYALLEAKAYAASPGRPGVVNALSQVFVVIDIIGPLGLGVLADSAGVRAALAGLALQPLGVLLVLRYAARRSRHSPSGAARSDSTE